MDYKKKEVEKNKFEYTIVVPADMIKQCHDKAVESLGRNAKVPGFRKGHVPMEVLERAIDPARVADVEINEAVNATLVELIEKEDIQPLDQPVINLTKYVPNQTIEYTATIEVVPPVKLADVKKLETKRPEVKVADKEVNDVIERLRTNAAEKTAVDRAAKKGDEVIIDFTGLLNGKEFAGGKAKDYELKLGSGAFIPGFEEGIEGHKAGEEFDVNVTFPEEYGAKELAGQKSVFKVKLNKVNELKLPELNDEFAKGIAPDFKNMDDLKKDVRKNLEQSQEAENRQKFEDDLLSELAEKSNVDIPEVLVKDQLPQMEQQFTQGLMYRGLDLDGYLSQKGMTKEEWEKKELRPAAEKRVRNSLVISQFAKDNHIEVTAEEIKGYRDKILDRYTNENIRKQFETPEYTRQIAQQLATEKAMAKLVELAGK